MSNKAAQEEREKMKITNIRKEKAYHYRSYVLKMRNK